MTKEHVTSVADIAGSIAIIIGAASLSAAAGWIVGGALGLLLSWRLSR
jgi:hypothetical protein